MADWVDRNFEALCSEGFLKRGHGNGDKGKYSLTEQGAMRAAHILHVTGCLNGPAYQKAASEAQRTMLQRAAERWLSQRSRHRQPGTKDHILIDLFRESLH